MKKLKSNLGYILTKKKISVHKLSVDLKHIRSTIASLAYNDYLINNRIPADLIVGLCDYLSVTIGELFEIVEFVKISVEELLDILFENDFVQFIHEDKIYEILKNSFFDDNDLKPELWSVIKDNDFQTENLNDEQVIEWVEYHIEDDIWIEK